MLTKNPNIHFTILSIFLIKKVTILMVILMDFLKICLTAVLSIAELFILTKIIGRRQISELSFFDYINGITIGSIAADMAFVEIGTIWKPALAMLIYGLFSTLLSIVGDKSIGLRRIIDGEALILLNNGKLYRNNFKKSKLNINEFLTQCRINGYYNLDELQTAIIEPNGRISFLPKAIYHPATPKDLGIPAEKATVPFVAISDGKILTGNLEGSGKNEIWLREKLKEENQPPVNKIFLAMCDGNNLTVFEKINTEKSRDIYN